MRITNVNRAACILVVLLAACSNRDATPDPAAYAGEINAWRADRAEFLKGPRGYVNLVGLYWLEKDRYRIGAAADNDIVFPSKAAGRIGELEVTPDGVVLTAEPGVEVLHDGSPVERLLLADDTTDNPVTVTHGPLAWKIIRRDARYALRLRDYEHPGIAAFPDMQWYAVDPAWRIEASLRPYSEPRVLNVDTTIEGLGFHPESPGKLVFAAGGETHELEAYISGDSLFIIFADRTTGRDTYPAGRYMYLDMPDSDGNTIIDFNKAFSPPCAYNDFATCPVASPRNRLALRVEAGEKFDPAIHKTGALD